MFLSILFLSKKSTTMYNFLSTEIDEFLFRCFRIIDIKYVKRIILYLSSVVAPNWAKGYWVQSLGTHSLCFVFLHNYRQTKLIKQGDFLKFKMFFVCMFPLINQSGSIYCPLLFALIIGLDTLLDLVSEWNNSNSLFLKLLFGPGPSGKSLQ